MNPTEKLLYPHGKTSLFFVAQAGFILKSANGTTMGIDLYLSDCVERFDGFKRLSPKVFRPDELELDYLAATHWHLDHFDIDSIPILMANGKTKLICAEDCCEHVQNLHLDESRVTYVRVGTHVTCEDIDLDAVFCDHGTGAPLAVGLVVTIDGYKIYIAGDTSLRLDKAPEIAKYGPFDVMIAPINGAFGNLNEAENVQLCAFHKPKLNIPCHFWTFAEHYGNPGIYMNEMMKMLPDQKYCIMAPGEQIFL